MVRPLHTEDRRRSGRIDVLGEVAVINLSHQTLTVLHGISIDGFMVEATRPVEVGESHRFEFRFPSSPIQVDATCRHVARTTFSTVPTYRAGFAFGALDGQARKVLMAFMDQQVRRQLPSAV